MRFETMEEYYDYAADLLIRRRKEWEASQNKEIQTETHGGNE